ncbi:phosphotransferase family protein [Luteitalea sp.]
MPDRSPSALETVLARLPADVARHLGVPAVHLDRVTVVERPVSHVARLRVVVDGQTSPACGLYVKVFKPKRLPGGPDAMRTRVVHEFDTMRRVHAALADKPGLGVVPPVACYPDLLTTVTQEVAGPTLLEYLPTRTAWWAPAAASVEAADVMRRCGGWLRALQEVDVPSPAMTPDEIAAYIDVRLARLERDGGRRFAAPWRTQVLALVHRLGRELSPDDLVPRLAHADVALANVLVAGDAIVVLDFAMARPALRLHDLTRLSLQLDLLAVKPHINGTTVRHLQSALREGFEPGLSDAHPLHRLLTLLHRVNHLGTLTLKPARFPEALYNGAVARAHRRWIATELDRGAGL